MNKPHTTSLLFIDGFITHNANLTLHLLSNAMYLKQAGTCTSKLIIFFIGGK